MPRGVFRKALRSLGWAAALLGLGSLGLLGGGAVQAGSPDVPRGYLQRLIVEHQGRIYRFGPFVGYAFKPVEPTDLTRLELVCFNERSFYTEDVPEGELLFRGEARFGCLPLDQGEVPASRERMIPVFAEDIPESWLQSRPEPQEAFRHFHSCYNAAGAVPCGFWLRHEAVRAFTYDMGGRVGQGSPLYHQVDEGLDGGFPLIVEFDQGPRRE